MIFRPDNLKKDILTRIFKRDDIRGLWPDELDESIVFAAGKCFAEMLMRGGGSVFVVGHDARTGSASLEDALSRGIEAAGGRVESLGICSSEQVYYMTGRYGERFCGGAMVTASHNPADYNGIKFVHAGALPFRTEELAELKSRMGDWLSSEESVAMEDSEASCSRVHLNIGQEFAEYMYGLSGMAAEPPVDGMPLKITVGAGNGVGAVAFRPLGSLLASKNIVFDYLDAEPDGRFPNGVPNPLLPEYNERLGVAVRQAGAYMGIGFDGDADRAGFIDENGTEIIPSQILAIVSSCKLTGHSQSDRRSVIMSNLCCSQLIRHLYADVSDVEWVETPVGHGQIKQLMRHPNYADRVVFAGEHSGHYFYPEFFSVDSGILTSLYMIRRAMELRRAGRMLSSELSAWRSTYHWSGELNYRMPDDIHLKLALGAVRHFDEGAEKRRLYEIRTDPALGLPRVFEADKSDAVTFPDIKIVMDGGDGSGWWAVIRPSGNEPLLRLNVEVWNQSEDDLNGIVARIEQMLATFGAVS